MTTDRHTSNRKCPDCGEPLFQNDPRSNIFGCDNEKCMAPWRLINGRLSKEIGKKEILKRMFTIRYYKQENTDNLGKLLKAVKPWWRVW